MSQRKKIIIICLHITDEMSQRKKNIYVFANILEKKKRRKVGWQIFFYKYFYLCYTLQGFGFNSACPKMAIKIEDRH
jgi:hypothetical protein